MYEGAVQDLIDELGRLPGVGPKSAQRIAFHLLQSDAVDVQRLSDALTQVKAKVRFCTICFNIAESELCRICADTRRDLSSILTAFTVPLARHGSKRQRCNPAQGRRFGLRFCGARTHATP